MLRAWMGEMEPLVVNEIAQGGLAVCGLYQNGGHDAPRLGVRGSYICLLQRADNCIMELLIRGSCDGES
jgi:hypothetical protein